MTASCFFHVKSAESEQSSQPQNHRRVNMGKENGLLGAIIHLNNAPWAYHQVCLIPSPQI